MRRTPRSARRSASRARCHRLRGRDLTGCHGGIDAALREIEPNAYLSVFPKIFEPIGSHFGVPDRVLNVLVPEVVLQRPRVVAIVGELVSTGMAKHVRVDREWHLGGLAEALNEPVETDGTDWPAAFGNEHVGVGGVIAA